MEAWTQRNIPLGSRSCGAEEIWSVGVSVVSLEKLKPGTTGQNSVVILELNCGTLDNCSVFSLVSSINQNLYQGPLLLGKVSLLCTWEPSIRWLPGVEM